MSKNFDNMIFFILSRYFVLISLVGCSHLSLALLRIVFVLILWVERIVLVWFVRSLVLNMWALNGLVLCSYLHIHADRVILLD